MSVAHTYYSTIKKVFSEAGDPVFAEERIRYMRYKFEYYGLKAPTWVGFLRTIFSSNGLLFGEDLRLFVELCYVDEYREMQYAALQMLEKSQRKQADVKNIILFEKLIKEKAWWDTVDWLASLVGAYFLHFPKEKKKITSRWIKSKNIWLNRVAIIFQLKYRDNTDEKLLFAYIKAKSSSNEFFIQKAIGWALRQYSKVAPDTVLDFIEHNPLPALSKREGIKWLKKQGRA